MSRPSSTAFALVAMMALTALPASADSPVPNCVNLAVLQVGQGLGIWALTDPTDSIGIFVASGVPGDGLTLGMIVVPNACGAGEGVDSLLTTVPSTIGQEMGPAVGKLPILP